MYKKIFMSVIFIFVLTLLLNGLSFAQNNNDSNQSSGTMKMNEHMVMEHNQSKQSDSAIVRKGEIDIKAIDENGDGRVFQDQMDFNVISDKPGKCPLCGMKLKEVTLEKAAEDAVKHGFKITNMTEENSIIREGVIGLNQIDENKDGKVYEDMMDYNVISDKPGTCPLCGMTLKEVSLEKAKSNLSKNGFTVK